MLVGIGEMNDRRANHGARVGICSGEKTNPPGCVTSWSVWAMT